MANDVLQMPTRMPSPAPALNSPNLPPPVQPPGAKRAAEADAQNPGSDGSRSSQNSTPEKNMNSANFDTGKNSPSRYEETRNQQQSESNEPPKNTDDANASELKSNDESGVQQPKSGSEIVNTGASSAAPVLLPVSLTGPSETEDSQQKTSKGSPNQSGADNANQGAPATSPILAAQNQSQVMQQLNQTPAENADQVRDTSASAEKAVQEPMIGSDKSSDTVSQYTRRNIPIAPAIGVRRSGSSPPTVANNLSGTPAQTPDHHQQHRPGFEHPVCANCGTTKTPLWRRGPTGQNLCNACGLYVKARNINRPTTLKRSPVTRMVPLQSIMGSCPGDGRCNGTGGSESCPQCPSFNNNRLLHGQTNKEGSSSVNMVSCQNCGTVTTPLWRRDSQGHIICNACGLYNRIHKDSRPSDLRTSVIKRRRRNTHASSDSADERTGTSSNGAQLNEAPAAKLSQPPSPETRTQSSHSHGPNGSDDLCCEHVSPALQQPHQYSAPAYGAQPVPTNQGATGPYSIQGPPQPQHQPQKPGSVPYGYYAMGQGGPMGLSVMLPPPGAGYMGHPWPMQPPVGSQYPYPTPPHMPMPAQGPPPAFVQSRQSNSPQAPSHQSTPSYPGNVASHQPSQQQSLSPQVTPHAQEGIRPFQPQPQTPQEVNQSSEQQKHAENLSRDGHPVPRVPGGQASVKPDQNRQSASPRAEQVTETRAQAGDSRDSVPLTKLHELQRNTSTGALDSSDSPLAVLQYLKGASRDTISEYLLAAQRQLNDKVNQLRRGLSRAELQLRECEDALKEINKSGPNGALYM